MQGGVRDAEILVLAARFIEILLQFIGAPGGQLELGVEVALQFAALVLEPPDFALEVTARGDAGSPEESGHEEAEGTIAVAPDSVHRVEHPDDVDALPDLGDNVAILAQTTLSHRDWAGVVDAASQRWPDLWSPGRSDLCFATTNRQGALLDLVDRCDAVVVIGSTNSSNTRALVELATEAGCDRVVWINRAEELPDDLAGTIGVTAGASAPEEVVTAVIEALAPVDGVETVRHTDEDEYFPPPRNLRDLLQAIRTFAGLGFGAPPAPGHLDDRAIDASDALTALGRPSAVG